MLVQKFPLVSWSNGTVMIAVFGLVSLLLIIAVILLVSKGKGIKGK